MEMDMQSREMNAATTAGSIDVRLARREDLPVLLDISNWAIQHTAANFKTEPETLDHWTDLWNGKSDTHPWFVAERGGALVGFAMASPFQGR